MCAGSSKTPDAGVARTTPRTGPGCEPPHPAWANAIRASITTTSRRHRRPIRTGATYPFDLKTSRGFARHGRLVHRRSGHQAETTAKGHGAISPESDAHGWRRAALVVPRVSRKPRAETRLARKAGRPLCLREREPAEGFMRCPLWTTSGSTDDTRRSGNGA